MKTARIVALLGAAALAALVACGGSVADAPVHSTSPSLECPRAADQCPAGCVAVQGARYDVERACRYGYGVVGCGGPTREATDSVCHRRSDGVVVLVSSSQADGESFIPCDEALTLAAQTSPGCDELDASPSPSPPRVDESLLGKVCKSHDGCSADERCAHYKGQASAEAHCVALASECPLRCVSPEQCTYKLVESDIYYHFCE